MDVAIPGEPRGRRLRGVIGGSGNAGCTTVRELLAAFYPGVPLRDGVGEFDTPLVSL